MATLIMHSSISEQALLWRFNFRDETGVLQMADADR